MFEDCHKQTRLLHHTMKSVLGTQILKLELLLVALALMILMILSRMSGQPCDGLKKKLATTNCQSSCLVVILEVHECLWQDQNLTRETHFQQLE
jgi:Na+(H+)/acetate symporter ActP